MKWDEMTVEQKACEIATKIMGWQQDELGMSWETNDGRNIPIDDWFPWEDISAAWEVVEKMPDEFIVQKCVDETWFVTVYGDSVGRSGYCRSAPEAICKAALKSVGVDV